LKGIGMVYAEFDAMFMIYLYTKLPTSTADGSFGTSNDVSP